MIPFYVLLYYVFLRVVKVKEQIWKRAFILWVASQIVIVACSLVLGFVSIPYLSLGVAILIIAYILTKLLIIDSGKAVLASFLVVVFGQITAGIVLTTIFKTMVNST